MELFPKSYRFSLGILVRLTDASFQVERKQSLEIDRREVNRLRLDMDLR